VLRRGSGRARRATDGPRHARAEEAERPVARQRQHALLVARQQRAPALLTVDDANEAGRQRRCSAATVKPAQRSAGRSRRHRTPVQLTRQGVVQ